MTSIDPATCERVFRMFDDYLDRELAPAEIDFVRRHLEICAVCSSEIRFEDSLLHEVRGKLQRIAVPPDLHGRVWAAVIRAQRETAGGGRQDRG